MEIEPVPEDRDQPLRAEPLHESDHTRVTRVFLPAGTVIRKEPLGPDAGRRLRHELAMLTRLRGVAGAAQLLDAPRFPGSIVVADVGGTSLARRAKPLAVDDLIALAVQLASAVASMHQRGVMHRDITPANIVVSADGAPCLVDFALATSLAEIGSEFTHHSEIVGTLAYLAPEQTGRTGRSVDQRADLYALGATLYEVATGDPPFGSGDLLRLTHDHLARVPVPPEEVRQSVPGSLSAIIMHLLEKEPDHRYQTAEGVLYDLQRLQDEEADRDAAPIRIGVRDFPLRLLPPSRLVGRDNEAAALASAFEDALAGRCRGVLVSGMPGVGKTALVNELRSVVTGSNGWFVAGKFDQYRRDLEFDAVYQAFRALGRLLLAEPEDQLAQARAQIVKALGANAGLVCATSDEFAALLGLPPDAGDPLTAQVRAQRAAVEALRAVASLQRPVVLFADDLQWAGRAPLGFIELVLGEEPVEGLLLVGAFRDSEVDAAHPLAAPLSRWRDQAEVRHLQLVNLPAPGLVTMVAEMLHVEPAAVASLVEVIHPHTGGNPYETVELLNALRSEEVLIATAAGWRWDAAAARAHLGHSEVAELVGARIDAMPPAGRQAVEAMACLGGRAEMRLLQAATGASTDVMENRLGAAFDQGVLVVEPGVHQAVRFRHDRIREAVLKGLHPQRRRALQLALARRLAGVPELFAVAVEQYLPVIDAVDDAVERRQLVGLLRRAADQAALTGSHARVSELLAAALRLIEPSQTNTLIEVRTGRHAALFCMGYLDEADEEYRAITGLGTTALSHAEATCVQVRSLTNRIRLAEAIGLGVESLAKLGITVPDADRLPTELGNKFDHLYRWLDHEAADDLARPDITDPTLIAATRLINAILPATYFAEDLATHGWLSLEALRIWIEHGPGRTLIGPASTGVFTAVALGGDYSRGYRAMRRILALGEARGYEPDTSQARYLFAVQSCWSEPIEDSLHAAHRAREGLIAGADLTYAGYTYQTAASYLMDCASSLNVYAAEVEAGLAFARKTGGEQTGQWLDNYRWLADVLRGERSATAGEVVPIDSYAGNPLAVLYSHTTRAVVAAVFGDQVGLARHTASAMPMLPVVAAGAYSMAPVHVLRGLALTEQVRATNDGERDDLLAELDEVTKWLAARAADAPENFLHLVRLIEAERAWAIDDFRAATLAFDGARREVADRQRPWHRALITERSARFCLAHGLEHAGYDLLAQARHEYLAWGATAKADQLSWAYPTLRSQPDATAEQGDQSDDYAHRRSAVTTGTIDLLAILSASQALSSQTSIESLHARVVEVLRTMTGATGVYLVLWNDDRQGWLMPAPEGAVEVDTGHECAVPMSVLRYAQRMGEPLVVGDATSDDRFGRDPYFADVECCSLLALPILNRGKLQALLLLENRLIRGAFSTERLDALKLIAGQLAVSLDNAQLYAELTMSRARIVAAADQARRRIERDLHDGAQQNLVSLALGLRAAQGSVPPGANELTAELDELATQATAALDELRELARGIHPAVLAEGGLSPALETLAQRCTVPVELDVRVERRLHEHIEIAAYYLVAEALTNVAKHAHASTVQVKIDTGGGGDGVLRVRVSDDGCGGTHLVGGSGLVGLKDRVDALAGSFWVQTAPGAGTTVCADFPLGPARMPTPARADTVPIPDVR